eukprot:scaffold22901_cov42-Attheya_sp.AAC.1
MPVCSRGRSCSQEVKRHLKHSHRRCDHSKLGGKVYGKILNGIIGSEVLEEDTQYPVCATIVAKVNKGRRTAHKKILSSTPSSTPINRTPINMGSVVRVSANFGASSGPAGGRGESATIFDKSHPPRSGYYSKEFRHGVATCGQKYRKPFRKVNARERSRRITILSKEILGTCVDTSCLVEDGANYLKNNKEVAVDVLTVLDGIRHRIQRELEMNLNLQNLHETMTPHVVDVGDESVERHIDFDSVSSAVLYNTAVAMLSTATKTGYALIRKRFIEDSKFDGKDLPSFQMLTTKNRPKISPMLIVPA